MAVISSTTHLPHPTTISKAMQIEDHQPIRPGSPLKVIIMVASIAAGVQFGWALQLSLLTPYVQLLGVPHQWASFIWLCGPISGLVVQPIVGYHSDRCTSRFGRRRPFIASGAALVGVAVFLIGYAADIGHRAGDLLEKKTKPRAVAVFVVGFWILDVANNMLQGPCRALLADLSGDDPKKTRTANSLFSFFMAVGNVLGYAAGSYTKLFKIFPFTATTACDMYCANLKSCFFISIALLATVTVIALVLVKEEQFVPDPKQPEKVNRVPLVGNLYAALREMKKPMWILMLVTCLNWIAWFPFFLYNTDWMGKEVYGGAVGTSAYDKGVRAGSLGLMLNAIVLGVVSLLLEPVARRIGVKKLWGGVNFVLAICLAFTLLVTKMAEAGRKFDANGLVLPPSAGVKGGALALFSALGIPLAVTYSLPFALASIFCNSAGAGQGLSIGVLNLAIVLPQMFVSVTSGGLDALFGGGNLPAFLAGAIAAAVSGLLALTLLPTPPPDFVSTTQSAPHF
ncbi:unnamed protein product [Rhodiola kirilowii]